MKRIIASMAFAALAVAGVTTHAQAVTHTINMTASVGGVCTIGTPNALNGFATGTSLIATASSGLANYKIANMTLPYNCTSANVQFQLRSGSQGITRTAAGTPPTGQTNKIHYSAKFFIGSGSVLATLNTSSASSTAQVNQAISSGDLKLEVEIPAGTTTLMPGEYADQLHVDVVPNP